MNIKPVARIGLCLLTACGHVDKDTAGDDPVCDGEAAAVTDDNNYRFTGSLTVPRLVTASGEDVTVRWDQVVEDLQCHSMDPATDVDVVGVVRFGNLSQAEVEQGLSSNDLQQSEMSGYAQIENKDDATTGQLADMSFFGTAFDLANEYVEGGGTYLMLLTTGTTPGVGARMVSFLEPTMSSSVTAIDVPNGCGPLSVEADLASRPPVRVCADGPNLLDWSQVSTDGQGNPFDAGQVDGLMIGFYEGQSATDIEADFLDLELNATRLYTLALAGQTSADLSEASDGADPFPGFEGDGVWLFALRCSRCFNPAPLVVAVLQPETDPE